MPITNRDLASLSGQVFAHTADYQLPAMFANRVNSRSALRAFLTESSATPRAAFVSDMLGSGKTFLVELATVEQGLPDQDVLMCGRNKPDRMADAANRGAIVIDEWDIKAPPKTLSRALEHVAEFVSANEAPPPLVIIGDRTLRGSAFRNRWLDFAEIQDIEMESLTPDFFRLALAQRLANAFSDQAAGLKWSPDGYVEQIQQVIDPVLEESLVPDWPETASVFRMVLRILKEMADQLPINSDKAHIGRDEATAWLNKQSVKMTNQQIQFYRDFVGTLGTTSGSVAPMSLADLNAMTGATSSDEDLLQNVVVPLARNGLIGALGIPTFSDDGKTYDRFPGPYLPTPATMVRIAYGVMP